MSVPTNLNSLRVQLLYLLSSVYGRTVAYHHDAIENYLTIATGDVRARVLVHTLRWINGQSAPGTGQRQHVVKLEMDFWGRMASESNETDFFGSFPSGEANSDWNTFGDPQFWTFRFAGNSANVQGMDEDTPPTFEIERLGMIVHWKITVALVAII